MTDRQVFALAGDSRMSAGERESLLDSMALDPEIMDEFLDAIGTVSLCDPGSAKLIGCIVEAEMVKAKVSSVRRTGGAC